MKSPIYISMKLEIFVIEEFLALPFERWPKKFTYGINNQEIRLYLLEPQVYRWFQREVEHRQKIKKSKKLEELWRRVPVPTTIT